MSYKGFTATPRSQKYPEFKVKTVGLRKKLKMASQILIFSHLDPDRDTLASNFALNELLSLNLNLNVISIIFGEIESGLVLPSPRDRIKTFSKHINSLDKQLLENLIRESDTIIFVDVCQARRVVPPAFRQKFLDYIQAKKVIVIDHHPKNSTVCFKPDICINESSSSTAELIWTIFVEGLKFRPNAMVARNILLGILADTRNFKYLDVGPQKFFRNVTNIMEYININDYFRTYEAVSEKLPQNFLDSYKIAVNNLQIYKDIAITFLDYEDVSYKGDAEEFMQFILYVLHNLLENITGVNLSVFVYPDFLEGRLEDRCISNGNERAYRVSLRTHVGSCYNVEKLAANIGGGGRNLMGGAMLFGKDAKAAVFNVEQMLELK